MTSNGQDEAVRLFEAIRAAGPAHRDAVLAALDPELRKEVESLLAAEDDFLEKTPPGVDSVTVEKSTAIKQLSPGTKAPARIGPYHILREIGEGGMGVV